jgi:hypothetical protein
LDENIYQTANGRKYKQALPYPNHVEVCGEFGYAYRFATTAENPTPDSITPAGQRFPWKRT